ncbi:DUF6982 domain-containing protein [Granulicella arctica]|uniref:Uncharacterized protein n=1 Tax=Granulicella arctica TaxID=940613 RepID=A0A7Y9PHQ2_9BACT|nr:hypothetical protein [Granulicella arctica]NYF79935.1 hypothetical protein [Granulicella arctica]
MIEEHLNHWPEGMVVIHKGNSLIRGTAFRDQPITTWGEPGGVSIRIARSDTGLEEEVSLADAKAVFFVRSFSGKSAHEDLHFYDAAAAAPFLWVRITFFDGEVMECLVENSEEVVISPAFFARPVDPEANNWMAYIVKRKIKHFQVLAVRHLLASQQNSNGAALQPSIAR